MASSSSTTTATTSSYEPAPIFPLSQQCYTLVEMPCRVKNPERAINMVGGISSIEKVVNNEHKFLELRFRGSMSHPAHGDKQSTNHLLLRVRRNRKKRRDFKFEVLGKVVNCVGFQGMVDFQFVQDDIFDASKTSLESSSSPMVTSSSRTMYNQLSSSSSSSSSNNNNNSVGGGSSNNSEDEVVAINTTIENVDIQTRLISIDQAEDEARRRLSQVASSSSYLSLSSSSSSTENATITTTTTNDNNNNAKGKRGSRNTKSLVAPTPSTDFEKLTEKEVGKQLQNAMAQREKLNLTPPIFSRFDIPMDYEFRANPLSTMVSVTRDDGTTIFKRQLKRYGTRRPQVCQISFADSVPDAPDPNLEPVQFQEDEDRQLLMNSVRSLFNKRPIWSRRALEAQFESKKMKSHIKLVLPHIAFYYRDGPWRKLWVRYGVNPRTDKSTGMYQMLDFRVPAEFRSQVLQRRKEKGLMTESEEYGGVDLLRRAPKRRQAVHEDLRSIMFSTEPPGKGLSSSASQTQQSSTAQDSGDHTIENEDEEEATSKVPSSGQESYLFTSIPGQKSTVYQLCDIRLRAVQEIIKVQDVKKQIEVDDAEFNDEKQKMKRKNNDQYKFGTRMIRLRNSVCHEKYGWYTLDALEQIRFLMKKKIEQWIANGNEEEDEDILGVSDDEADDFEDDFAPQPNRHQQQQGQRVTETSSLTIVHETDEEEEDEDEYEGQLLIAEED